MAARQVVRYDLSEAEGIEAIREYAREKPFPREWTDEQIIARIRDAEKRATRGEALNRGTEKKAATRGEALNRDTRAVNEIHVAGESLTDLGNGKGWQTQATSAPAMPTPAEPEAPLPLERGQSLALPVHLFGDGWLGSMIEAVAKATETPLELSAGIGLGVLAVACQRSFCVMIEDGYFEGLNLFVCAALPSGSRKTATMMKLIRPLMEWEAERSADLAEEIARATAAAKTAQARISYLRTQAGKCKPGEYEALKNEIEELEATMPEVPVPPRLLCQDITPERVASLLAEHNECLGLFSDEGGPLDTMSGRYSDMPNLDIYLQGHAGAFVRVDRGSRPPVILKHPRLSMVIAPQPDVLRGLTANKLFRARGLPARFLFLLPVPNLGFRKLQTVPVPESVKESYARGLYALLDTPMATGKSGEPRPNILRLSHQAHAEWKAFAHEMEAAMRPGGRLEYLTDWASKAVGAVARIAGLLHCADYAGNHPQLFEVEAETMVRAVQMGRIFTEHALQAFDMMGADPAMDAARKVLAWIEREQATTFTARDCWRALRGSFKTTNEIEPAYDLLMDTGHISEVELTERKAGRPSRVFQVNPHIVRKWGVR